MTTTPPLAPLPFDAITAEALGEPADVVSVWHDRAPVPESPEPLLRLVYAFPSVRLVTLRHWRDEFEVVADGHRIVGMEASKLARLLLKGHGGTLLALRPDPVVEAGSLGHDAVALAEQLWIDEARDWAVVAARLAPRSGQTASDVALSAPERFDRVEAWLLRVRNFADARC